jgi:hypothetical protein
MGRLIRLIVFGVLLVGGITLGLERAGFNRFRCACSPDCWCKKPGLNLFRWITPPKWHSIAEDQRTASA